MDRARFEQLLGHLEGLADDMDGVAAAHGRAACALLASAGLSWPEVLVRPAGDGAGQLGDGYDHAPLERDDPEDGDALPHDAAVRAALTRLLARSDLGTATRDDLAGFAEAASADALDHDDARYILALDARLRGRAGS